MQISYDKLWKLMIDKKINKTQLKEMTGVTSNCMAKMGKNEPVHVETLLKICEILGCKVEDIIETIKCEGDKNE